MMIVFWLGIGVLVYYLLSNRDTGRAFFSGNRSPEELLKERFVRGEIDERTYLQMNEAIK